MVCASSTFQHFPIDLTQTVSWDAIESTGILLEMALLFLPIYLVWDLQMSYWLKAMVLSAFAFRIPIIPLAIARIRNLNVIANSTDYTFDVVLAIVFAQVEMHYSLIAATIPCQAISQSAQYRLHGNGCGSSGPCTS